ncbi:MAG: cell wall hydrolase [Clostridia bacterium]|nr:cell wall hydrolase [Clostridia bacterium]
MKRAVCAWLAVLAALLPAEVCAADPGPAGAVPEKHIEELEKCRLTERDRAYLASMLAANYGGEPYAAQVGIAAVVLRRMHAAGYPDSAAGVIAALASEGEFTKMPSPEGDPGRLRRARDAVRDALCGMDPSDGALVFHAAPETEGFDLRFDDAREDAADRAAAAILADCRVVCGRIGFR